MAAWWRLTLWAASLTMMSHFSRPTETFTGTPGQYVKLEDTIKGFKGILEGKYDHLAESDFYMLGGIDQAVAKYEARISQEK